MPQVLYCTEKKNRVDPVTSWDMACPICVVTCAKHCSSNGKNTVVRKDPARILSLCKHHSLPCCAPLTRVAKVAGYRIKRQYGNVRPCPAALHPLHQGLDAQTCSSLVTLRYKHQCIAPSEPTR